MSVIPNVNWTYTGRRNHDKWSHFLKSLMLQLFAHEVNHLRKDLAIHWQIAKGVKVLGKQGEKPRAITGRLDILEKLSVRQVVFDCVEYNLRIFRPFTLPEGVPHTL